MGIPGNPDEDWSMLDWSGEKAELDLMLAAEFGLTPAVAEGGAGCSPHPPAWAW